jgi:hypothetical protein
MAIDVQRSLDFGGVRRITSLPDAIGAQEPVTKSQLDAAIEGNNWKINARVATQGNINISSPGATIDSVTMVSGDRVLVQANTNQTENGIYIWNGAAVALTRASDANTGSELVNAVISINEGTSAGTTRRQTAINVTIGSTSIVWGSFGTVTAPATTSSLGTVQIATQSEVNAGTDTAKSLTPATLKNSVFATQRVAQDIGDGSATLYTITHNLGTYDVRVEVYRNSGNRDDVLVEIRRPTINTVVIVFDTAPTSNAYRVLVSA